MDAGSTSRRCRTDRIEDGSDTDTSVRRRELLKRAGQGAVVASGLLAGCSANEDGGDANPTGTATETSAKPSLDQFGVGVYLGDEGALEPWEEWFGRTVDYYSLNVPRDGWEKYRIENMPLERPIADIAADREIVVTVHLYPPEQTRMIAVARGNHDEQFRAMARSFLDNDLADATLRISHEMNGRWAATGAVGRPRWYVAAWRQVVDVLDGVDGTDFSYIWAPHIGELHMDATEAYPGDDWVDKVGLTVYDVNDLYYPEDCDPECVRNRRRQVWDNIVDGNFGLNDWAQFARDHGKPLVFPEYGVTARNRNGAGGGDNPLFFRWFADWMLANSDVVEWHNVWSFVAGSHYIGPESEHQSSEFPRHADASEAFKSLYGG
ncbi:glycosyl hydrolase [Halobellus rarus]|uniref:Glycosyl hydrolase n=1 Tax=Halobellus rarus TaxID=1126237 RepID=A0ABD6CIE9_9EURY|nr:glycosyl hydrolase [Halobellus rarus]